MEDLQKNLSRSKRTQFIREVIHCALYEDGGDVFFFSYGVLICWGLRLPDERRLLADLRRFGIEEDPLATDDMKDDDFLYSYQDNIYRPLDQDSSYLPKGAPFGVKLEWPRIDRDEIILPICRRPHEALSPSQRMEDLLYKLSFSYGLATSIKLVYFEDNTYAIINSTKSLPGEMAVDGRISLNRKEMSQQIGKLFLNRSYINLHSETLDTPEFFWQFAELDPIYVATTTYLNIRSRVEVLNKRLNVCEDLLHVLQSGQNHEASASLARIVAVLLFINILVIVLADAFNLMAHPD